MGDITYKAYLLVRDMKTREVVHKVGFQYLNPNYVDRVTSGLLRNMDTENYIVDDSEVDAARKVKEMMSELNLQRIQTHRLLSWKKQHEKAMERKELVMENHPPGSPWHSRAKLESEAHQRELRHINAELLRRNKGDENG